MTLVTVGPSDLNDLVTASLIYVVKVTEKTTILFTFAKRLLTWHTTKTTVKTKIQGFCKSKNVLMFNLREV